MTRSGSGSRGSYSRAAERLLVDLVGRDAVAHEATRGLDELVAPAVVEADVQVERRVRRRRCPRVPASRRPSAGEQTVAPADEAHAHALRGEILELALDRLGEQVEQAANLVGRARSSSRSRTRTPTASRRRDRSRPRRCVAAPACRRDGPRSRASPRRRAQRPLPSMISATLDATSGSARLLVARRADEEANAILEARRQPAIAQTSRISVSLCLYSSSISFTCSSVSFCIRSSARCSSSDADLALLLEVLEVRDRVAAHVAQGDASLLGELADDLDELLAPLLGELRDRQPDQLAVVGRRQARGRTRGWRARSP